MNRQISLHCSTTKSIYIISKEGDRQVEFPSFGKAFKYASNSVATSTPLTIYNEIGKVVAETWVRPIRL